MNTTAAPIFTGGRFSGGDDASTNKKAIMKKELIERLAAEFCRVLRSWLTPEQLREAVTLNAVAATAGDFGVCHSHDHCDANQAMLDAWEAVFGKDTAPAAICENATEADKDRDDAIWNAAWALAKTKGFSL